MAKVGYIGATVQLVKSKGEGLVFFWSPSPKAEPIDNYAEILDFIMNEAEESSGVFVDKWSIMRGIDE